MGCQQIKEKRKEPINNQSKSTTNQPSDINQNSMKEQNVPPSPKDTPNKLEENPQISQKEITLQDQSYPQTDINNPANQSERPVLLSKNENKNLNQIDAKEGELLENKNISDNNNNILDFCKEEYIPSCIGKLCFDPIILFIYNSKKNFFNTQKYEYTLIDFEELNNTSTCCNGDNKLFVSGGIDKNDKAVDKLWIFDLLDYNVEGPIQMNGKYSHTMIFIPKKYIFFVGGNDENVFYLSEFILELSLTDIKILKYSQRKRAIASFILAKKIFNIKLENYYIQFNYSLNKNELKVLLKELSNILKKVI